MDPTYQSVKKQIDLFYQLTNTPSRDGYWRKVIVKGWRFTKLKVDEEDQMPTIVLQLCCYDKRRKTLITFTRFKATWRIKKGLTTKLMLAAPLELKEIIQGEENIPF